MSNPLDLAGPYSQSQNFLKESFKHSQSPAANASQIKPLLQTASSFRGGADGQGLQSARNGDGSSQRGLWRQGPVRARALQDNLAQKRRVALNRSAKPANIANAGGILYSSHAGRVQNLLGTNIVEESLMSAPASDLSHSHGNGLG